MNIAYDQIRVIQTRSSICTIQKYLQISYTQQYIDILFVAGLLYYLICLWYTQGIISWLCSDDINHNTHENCNAFLLYSLLKKSAKIGTDIMNSSINFHLHSHLAKYQRTKPVSLLTRLYAKQ